MGRWAPGPAASVGTARLSNLSVSSPRDSGETGSDGACGLKRAIVMLLWAELWFHASRTRITIRQRIGLYHGADVPSSPLEAHPRAAWECGTAFTSVP